MDVEVVIAEEGQALAVGGKLRDPAWVRIGGELDGGSIVDVVEPQLSLSIEEQMLGIGSPLVGGDVVASDTLFLALIL